MIEKHPTELSDKELIDLSLNDRTSNLPLSELIRRNIIAINNLNRISARLSFIMIILTVALLILTFVMIFRV